VTGTRVAVGGGKNEGTGRCGASKKTSVRPGEPQDGKFNEGRFSAQARTSSVRPAAPTHARRQWNAWGLRQRSRPQGALRAESECESGRLSTVAQRPLKRESEKLVEGAAIVAFTSSQRYARRPTWDRRHPGCHVPATELKPRARRRPRRQGPEGICPRGKKERRAGSGPPNSRDNPKRQRKGGSTRELNRARTSISNKETRRCTSLEGEPPIP